VIEAGATMKGLRIIWIQLNLRKAEGRELAERQGVTAIEHRRLFANRNSA